MKKSDKHIPYFELIDAFVSDKCPICYLIEVRVNKFYENLLYENVNNPKFRDKFYKNGGFCNFHSHKLASYNDGLAVSLLYRDMVLENIDILSSGGYKKFVNDKNKSCMVCEFVSDIERRYINIFNENQSEDEFKKKFLNSKGLCVPHLQMLIKNSKAVDADIVDFHIKKYKEQYDELQIYIDSCNFTKKRVEKVSKVNEKIWRDIVDVIVGNKEVK